MILSKGGPRRQTLCISSTVCWIPQQRRDPTHSRSTQDCGGRPSHKVNLTNREKEEPAANQEDWRRPHHGEPPRMRRNPQLPPGRQTNNPPTI